MRLRMLGMLGMNNYPVREEYDSRIDELAKWREYETIKSGLDFSRFSSGELHAA